MTKLYVIAGHGGGDPGAGGCGYDEHERVVALGKAIVARGNGEVDHYPWDKNCYADHAMDWLDPGCPIVELHMDSGGGRGGHVIIPSNYGGADKYDNAIADLMRELFPGRANLIVERGDLRNCNVAKRRSLNYRLTENGFIDSWTDVNTFNARIDEIADRYLAAFGIKGGDMNPQEPGTPTNDNGFYYRSHVEDFGWLDAVHDGQVSGTVGRSKQLEAFKITPPDGIELSVKAHIAKDGWKTWHGIKRGKSSGEGSSENDPIIGTVGERKAIEAIEIVVDKNTTGKKLMYQVHVGTVGWTGWVDAGYATGTVGLGKPIEAIRFVLK